MSKLWNVITQQIENGELKCFHIFFDDPETVIQGQEIYKVNENCYCLALEKEYYPEQIDIVGPIFSSIEYAIAYAQSRLPIKA